MSGPRTSLESLPPEILHQIHLLARNPALSQISTTIHAFLSPPYTSSYYTATYLLSLYPSTGPTTATRRPFRPDEILTRALRHPICTVQVAKDIKRIWDQRRGYVEPHPVINVDATTSNGGIEPINEDREDGDQVVQPPLPPPPTKPALTVPELPRRLFRSLSPVNPIPPLLEYLFQDYSPNPNSHNGFPLSRAVLSKNLKMVKYLLEKGADPGTREGLAIEIAVKLGDLRIVKMLVEASTNGGSSVEGGVMIPAKWVEAAVKSGSDEIVSYFVHEKGVMPPLHSIMQLGQGNPGKKRKLQNDDIMNTRQKHRKHTEKSSARAKERRATKDKTTTRTKDRTRA